MPIRARRKDVREKLMTNTLKRRLPSRVRACRESPAHPGVAFVAVVARMPHQPERQGDGPERLANALEPELLLENRGKGRRNREQRIAVQREQQADQDGGDARGNGCREFVGAKRAVDQVDGGKAMHGNVALRRQRLRLSALARSRRWPGRASVTSMSSQILSARMSGASGEIPSMSMTKWERPLRSASIFSSRLDGSTRPARSAQAVAADGAEAGPASTPPPRSSPSRSRARSPTDRTACSAGASSPCRRE